MWGNAWSLRCLKSPGQDRWKGGQLILGAPIWGKLPSKKKKKVEQINSRMEMSCHEQKSFSSMVTDRLLDHPGISISTVFMLLSNRGLGRPHNARMLSCFERKQHESSCMGVLAEHEGGGTNWCHQMCYFKHATTRQRKKRLYFISNVLLMSCSGRAWGN